VDYLDPSLSAALYRCFAAGPGGGSMAAVVLAERELPAGTMRQIGTELGVPTTGFVLVPDGGQSSSVSMRFFTPKQEIDACGYVIVAAATALVREGRWKVPVAEADDPGYEVRTAGGRFPITLRGDESAVEVGMDQELLISRAPRSSPDQIRARLGRPPLDAGLRPWVAGTGLRHLLVPVADTEALGSISLDGAAISSLARDEAVDTIAVFALTSATATRFSVRMRDLCAGIGDIEEPASGTTAGAIAAYLSQERAGQGASEIAVEVEQGVEMGRPCQISAKVLHRNGARPLIRVSGRAVPRLTGRLHLS
jgi:PhzF family phenazine biosynthesis protein